MEREILDVSRIEESLKNFAARAELQEYADLGLSFPWNSEYPATREQSFKNVGKLLHIVRGDLASVRGLINVKRLYDPEVPIYAAFGIKSSDHANDKKALLANAQLLNAIDNFRKMKKGRLYNLQQEKKTIKFLLHVAGAYKRSGDYYSQEGNKVIDTAINT